MKKTTIILMMLALIGLTSCNRDAQVASRNLSIAADMFEIDRRVIFYNWITWEYILTIEGKCSIASSSTRDMTGWFEVTCKVGEWQFKKHFLWLSDNVTYFAEQVRSKGVSVYHNRIIFKPQSIIPEVDINVDERELLNNRH